MQKMGSKRLCAVLAATGCAVVGLASDSFAVPALQLDILNGTYVNSSSDPAINGESTVAASDTFRLYAYASPSGSVSEADILADKYRISMAVLPSLSLADAGDLGSFTFEPVGGSMQTVNVTADMNFGTPPLETILDNNDLQGHSVFETFYVEHEFMFIDTQISGQYDVELSTGIGPQALDTGNNPKNMFWVAFNIDVSNLEPGYAIHFDLYNTELVNVNNPNAGISEDLAVDMFAPFSHDAQSDVGNPPSPTPPSPSPSGSPAAANPEPISAVLSAMGLSALGVATRRRQS